MKSATIKNIILANDNGYPGTPAAGTAPNEAPLIVKDVVEGVRTNFYERAYGDQFMNARDEKKKSLLAMGLPPEHVEDLLDDEYPVNMRKSYWSTYLTQKISVVVEIEEDGIPDDDTVWYDGRIPGAPQVWPSPGAITAATTEDGEYVVCKHPSGMFRVSLHVAARMAKGQGVSVSNEMCCQFKEDSFNIEYCEPCFKSRTTLKADEVKAALAKALD